MRRFNSIYLAAILVLIAIALGWYVWKLGDQRSAQLVPTETAATVKEPGGPFQLVDQNNNAREDANFRGKYMLIYFGYTYCPDVCPTTLTNVAAALDKLGAKAERIQPLFITVDPKRDTPAVVRQYAAAFGPRVVGLTGTAEQIAAVAKAYRVYYAEHRTGPGADDYSMDHSSVLYLMGPDGRFIAPVRADQDGPEIAAALAKLMS